MGPDLLSSSSDRDDAIRRIVRQRLPPIAMTLLVTDRRRIGTCKSEVLFLSAAPERRGAGAPADPEAWTRRAASSRQRRSGSSPRIHTYRNLRQLSPSTGHDEAVGLRRRTRRAEMATRSDTKRGLEERSPTGAPPAPKKKKKLADRRCVVVGAGILMAWHQRRLRHLYWRSCVRRNVVDLKRGPGQSRTG